MILIFKVLAIGSESEHLDSVIKLHSGAKATLGFLPLGVFKEQADKGCLLVAMDTTGFVAGYALYGLPRREVRLTHLCISNAHRGQGCARILIEEIFNRHPDRTGIRAKCRRSFPANSMWPHLDFTPLNDLPGRSAQGHLLTTWWRDFGHPTLFTNIVTDVDRRIFATIDTDVFIDLDISVQPTRSDESLGLLADWISDEAQFLITKEVAVEVNRQDDAALRQRQVVRANAFPQAGETSQSFLESKEKLYAIIRKAPTNVHDISDLNQIARTHAAKISTFITRDEPLRSAHTKSAAALGVKIIAPGDFITALWSSINDTYAPVQLQNTHYKLESIAGVNAAEIAAKFLNPATGEKKKDLARQLRNLMSDSRNVDGKVVVAQDGSYIALMVRRIRHGLAEVPILRFASGGGESICRHVVHLQTSFARQHSLNIVKVNDEHASQAIRAALKDEGFFELNREWWSVSLPTAERPSVLAEQIRELDGVPIEFGLSKASTLLENGNLSPALEAELEQRFWPMKIKGASLPTFLVPIRAEYAKELFDSRLSEGTLFRQMELGISREQVYYRSPQPSGGIQAPARLLWYVTQKPGLAGSGMIRACSYLFEVDVDRPRTLFRRNSRLGVYRMSDVEDVARKGLTMALRFGLTEELKFPVPLNLAKRIAASRGCLNLQLQSPWRLPEGLFEDIYERATHASEQ